jgi:ABC-type glycerol-3-phosphate transport system permease component
VTGDPREWFAEEKEAAAAASAVVAVFSALLCSALAAAAAAAFPLFRFPVFRFRFCFRFLLSLLLPFLMGHSTFGWPRNLLEMHHSSVGNKKWCWAVGH